MRAIDTNVLVRLLLRDDAAHARTEAPQHASTEAPQHLRFRDAFGAMTVGG